MRTPGGGPASSWWNISKVLDKIQEGQHPVQGRLQGNRCLPALLVGAWIATKSKKRNTHVFCLGSSMFEHPDRRQIGLCTRTLRTEHFWWNDIFFRNIITYNGVNERFHVPNNVCDPSFAEENKHLCFYAGLGVGGWFYEHREDWAYPKGLVM